MKTKKLISIGKSIAISILILGIIHDIATFTPIIKSGLSCLSPIDLKAMTYMSLICGTSFILSGVMLKLLLKKVEEFTFLTTPILTIGIFLGASGILSILFMFDNPFAWIAFVLNMIILGISLQLKQRLDKQ